MDETASLSGMSKLRALLRRLGSWRFWGSAVVLMLLAGVGGAKLIDLKLVAKYQDLDPSLRRLLSVEDWWLETLAGACIPMFLIFALQFYSLRFFKDSAIKAQILVVMPFLPKLGWLAGKPVMLMLMTGALFIGMASRLEYPASALIGGAGALIVIFGFTVRYHYASLLSGRGFSQSTYNWAIRLGNICLLFAVASWLYADIWAPLKSMHWLWNRLGG
ncbi:hypothetical protein PS623_02450 [Pseudomonas fluorescens]|uniref:hypothetical protein n=1 Tax=Pseudomonas fluorescens TaxID=294 RepID=UPI001241BEFD|nr:hypothetical protein [Pseudomonas fluorescens]VVM84651.1 hypothetical protein PS623_02450 [Pseudomonas fluorescens]